MSSFFAHSGKAKSNFSDWQPLREHLSAVADLARRCAQEACPNAHDLVSAADAAGLLHDIGKYRKGYQEYLLGMKAKGDPLTLHKQAGAAKAAAANWIAVAFAVFGHHGGLPDRVDLKSGLQGEAANCEAIWSDAVADCPSLGTLSVTIPSLRGFQADLFTRVLFSCLVDADWTDTGIHQRRVDKLQEEPPPPPLDSFQRLAAVRAHIARKAENVGATDVGKIRADVLKACLDAADMARGIFSLTVPTGGGKTLSGLAFALKHAQANGLRRIIYVAPYMTILEQNAHVLREALGVGAHDPFVFEHYSLAEPPGDQQKDETSIQAAVRRAEIWDAPVIVTTNVQFFESLFSNKPGRCRKLHNIARSVIILDECQTLPPALVAPTCGMLKQLVAELGCTVVLCTATQPAFDHANLREDERLLATEIVPDAMRQPDENNLFVRLKRVQVSWPKQGEMLDWLTVAAQMLQEKSALCVVNTKKAARAVFEELKKCGVVGAFHLSTGMCPAHRLEKLTAIRERLDKRKPVFLVSTQLIEAGVDVDFPVVLREMAPLESIIQAAGRCNREGLLLNAGGKVLVFRSVEGKLPKSAAYKHGRDIVELILQAKDTGPQIDDPQAIKDYFDRFFHGCNLDGCGVRSKREKFQFATIALGEKEADGQRHGKNAYRLIDDPGEPVVAEKWASHQQEIAALLQRLESKDRPSRADFRELRPFQVNLLPSQVANAKIHLRDGPCDVRIWSSHYDDDIGIVEEMPDSFII
jgi:CRISPR-associated endonuclease/helicase Cas3